MEKPGYICLKDHYESCFREHGDSHRGVDWPNYDDALKRYQVMLDVVNYDSNRLKVMEKITFLDVGCGAGHFLEFLGKSDFGQFDYIGHDISQLFVEHCMMKYKNNKFICGDLLSDSCELPEFDYAVLNGLFTERQGMNEEEMFDFLTRMITKVFFASKKGVAFNVMSKNVDWERDDLFHLSLDKLTSFITKSLGRHFVVRNDYGLYEYSTYIYKHN